MAAKLHLVLETDQWLVVADEIRRSRCRLPPVRSTSGDQSLIQSRNQMIAKWSWKSIGVVQSYDKIRVGRCPTQINNLWYQRLDLFRCQLHVQLASIESSHLHVES
jgi:hypothetical protein